MNLEEQLKYLIDRYTDYIMSTNPEKGEFDLQTHLNLFQTLITKEIKQARKDMLEQCTANLSDNRDCVTCYANIRKFETKLMELNKD